MSLALARGKFGRIGAFDCNEAIVLEATRVQDTVVSDGQTLPARDLMIAATARSTGFELVVSDSNVETDALENVMTVTSLRQ